METKVQGPLLVVAPSLCAAPGGIQTLTLDLLESLRTLPAGCSLRVITKLDSPEQLLALPPEQLARVESVGAAPGAVGTFAFFLKIARACLCDRPALMVVVHRNHAPIALLMHWAFRVPYVVMLHGVEAWSIRGWWRRKAIRSAAARWCISKVTLDRVSTLLKLAPDRFVLLPCTADGERFSIGPKPQWLLERLGLTEDAKIVLTVARLASVERSKGYDRVLEAMPKLIERVPSAHYVLVGKGDDTARVEALVRALGLEERVTLTGFVSDPELPDFYRLCDVFALPSSGEGFGIVFLEALLSGKRCVGGASDGSREPLRDGALGTLIEVDDRDALVQALATALEREPNDAEWLRAEALKHFGMPLFTERLAEAVERLLAEHQ